MIWTVPETTAGWRGIFFFLFFQSGILFDVDSGAESFLFKWRFKRIRISNNCLVIINEWMNELFFNLTVRRVAKAVTPGTPTRWNRSKEKRRWTDCRYHRRCWTCCTFLPFSWSCAWTSKCGRLNAPNSPGWWVTSSTSTCRSLTPWPRRWVHSIFTFPSTRTCRMEHAIDGWILAFYPSAASAFYSIKSRFNILKSI